MADFGPDILKMTKEGWSDLSKIACHEVFGDMMDAMAAIDYERKRRLASGTKDASRASKVIGVTRRDISNVAKKMMDSDYLEQLSRHRQGCGSVTSVRGQDGGGGGGNEAPTINTLGECWSLAVPERVAIAHQPCLCLPAACCT